MGKPTDIRKATARYFTFLVGVELFSRFAFVKLLDRNQYDFTDDFSMTEMDRKARTEQLTLFNVLVKPSSAFVRDSFREWFKQINDMGYVLRNVINDNGGEFLGEAKSFLANGAEGIFNDRIEEFNSFLEDEGKEKLPIPLTIYQVQTVANDRVANPIAERFIQTFKRLVGQYMSATGYRYILQQDVDKIVDYYNNRVHSSTGYTPYEVLGILSPFTKKEMNDDDVRASEDKIKDDSQLIQDTLYEVYRRQKGEMYDQPNFEKPIAGVELDKYICRIFSKWNNIDNNLGDKKSDRPNYSWTLYKLIKYDSKNRTYVLNVIGEKDRRDYNIMNPPKEGLRIDFIKLIRIDDYKNYNINYRKSNPKSF